MRTSRQKAVGFSPRPQPLGVNARGEPEGRRQPEINTRERALKYLPCEIAMLEKARETAFKVLAALALVDLEIWTDRPIAALANLRLAADRLDLMRATVYLVQTLARGH